MNEEKLMDAIGFIDEDIIAEADSFRRKKKRPVGKFIALAACVCLIVAASFALPQIPAGEPDSPSLQYFTSTTLGGVDGLKYGGNGETVTVGGLTGVELKVERRNPLGFTAVSPSGDKVVVKITKDTALSEYYGEYNTAKERTPLPKDLPAGTKIFLVPGEYRHVKNIFGRYIVADANIILIDMTD